MELPRLKLTDEVWAQVAAHIPGRRCRGVGDQNARRFVEGLLWISRTGAPWRDLPGYFGKWNTVYRRFRRWALSGVWQVIHVMLLLRRPTAKTLFIDSTIVRAHQHAAGGNGGAAQNAIGVSRGGRSTKLHILVSDHKTLLGFEVTAGQSADISSAPKLLRNVGRGQTVVGDRAYDADSLVNFVARRCARVAVPPRRGRRHQRAYDRGLYASRHEVERLFLGMKQHRRLATRYDKTVPSFIATVLAHAALRMLHERAAA